MINRKCAYWWENTSKNNCDYFMSVLRYVTII